MSTLPLPPRPHHGMPPLDTNGPPLSYFEFWPMWAFYPPVALYAAWLMLRHRGVLLPTVANPSFPGGGFVGESKAQILELALRHAPEWVAPFVALDRPTLAEQAVAGTTLDDELAREEDDRHDGEILGRRRAGETTHQPEGDFGQFGFGWGEVFRQ